MVFFNSSLGKRARSIAFAFACLGVIALSAYAEDATDQGDAGREPAGARRVADQKSSFFNDDEYNFSWLDPDKKVYVLQNRRYRKAKRIGIFLSGGLNLSNPFLEEYTVNPRLAFWLTEQFGIEGFFSKVFGYENSTYGALKNMTTSLPFVRERKMYYGGVLTWTPWYAKINFFNIILYFDWFLNGGLGQLSTTLNQKRTASNVQGPILNETFWALFYGTGLNFYINNRFTVRLDLLGMAYRATGADNATIRTRTSYDFTAGLGFLL